MIFDRCTLRRPREWTKARLDAAARKVKSENRQPMLFPEMTRYHTVEDRQQEIDKDS